MRVVIFDFDGTIADTFAVVSEIILKMQRRTAPLSQEEQVLLRAAALMQVKLRWAVKTAAQLDIPFWRLPFLVLVTKRILKKRMHEVQPYPGVLECIQALKEAGYDLYVVSANSTANITRFLEARQVAECFTEVYGDVRPYNKARTIRRIIKSYDQGKLHIAGVGDEDRDITAYKAAGIDKAVAVTWGYNGILQLEKAEPKYMVANAEKLLKILKKKS
jgi:phosphoglycolate phosphatase-like HAD superfamily hydrolase